MAAEVLASAVALPTTRNIFSSVSGTVVYFFFDLAKDFGPSTTKKSTIIASSCGRRPLGVTGAYISMNVFAISGEMRRLDEAVLAPLRTRANFGRFCYGYVVEGTTFCIEVDFSNIRSVDTGSAHSVLLASSAGTRPIGETGVSCCFSCLRFPDSQLDLTALSSLTEACRHPVGSNVDLRNGFRLRVESPTEVTVTYRCRRYELRDKVSLPPFLLDGKMIVALRLRYTRKRQRDSSGEERKERKRNETVLVPNASSFASPTLSSRNVKARYTVTRGEGKDELVLLELRFDPTYVYNAVNPSKPVVIARTGGWVDLEHGLMFSFSVHKVSTSPPGRDVNGAVSDVLGVLLQDGVKAVQLRFSEVFQQVLEKLGTAAEADNITEGEVRCSVINYFRRERA